VREDPSGCSLPLPTLSQMMSAAVPTASFCTAAAATTALRAPCGLAPPTTANAAAATTGPGWQPPPQAWPPAVGLQADLVLVACDDLIQASQFSTNLPIRAQQHVLGLLHFGSERAMLSSRYSLHVFGCAHLPGDASSCANGKYLSDGGCYDCPDGSTRTGSTDYSQCSCSQDRPWVAATSSSLATCGGSMRVPSACKF
jgi:hypothetical protein